MTDQDSATIVVTFLLGEPQPRQWRYGEHTRSPKPRKRNKLRIADCIADCVCLAIPQATERQRIGNQIKTAFVFPRAYFVNVHAHKPLQCPSKGVGLKSNKRNCRQHCQTSKGKAL